MLATIPDLASLRPLLFAGIQRPPFLVPPPLESTSQFEPDLARLRETSPSIVGGELGALFPGGVPDHFHMLLSSPEEGLARLSSGFREYWQRALATSWPGIQTLLENEVLYRATTLVTHGFAPMVSDLHPLVDYCGNELHIMKYSTISLAARRLVFVPLAFGDGVSVSRGVDSDEIVVAYSAARDHSDWMRERDRLGVLLGRGRAAVLRATLRPATTLSLSRHLGLAAGTISEHLSFFVRVGLLSRRRAGRQVFYTATETGRKLVRILDDPGGTVSEGSIGEERELLADLARSARSAAGTASSGRRAERASR